MKKEYLQPTPQKYKGQYEWLYANKMNNLEEMDEFPEMYNLSRLTRMKQKIETGWLPEMKLNQ